MRDDIPRLVDGPLGQNHDGTMKCVELKSGWSHLVARVQVKMSLARDDHVNRIQVLGWGRSDKGQLGCLDKSVCKPQPLPGLHEAMSSSSLSSPKTTISQVACGSESTYLLTTDNNTLWSCGWNEHGNLGVAATDDEENVATISRVLGTERIVSPATYTTNTNGDTKLLMAAGGAHFLVMKTS